MNVRADSDTLGLLRRGVLGVLLTPEHWASVRTHLAKSASGVRTLEAVVSSTLTQGGVVAVLGDAPALLAVVRTARLVREQERATRTRAEARAARQALQKGTDGGAS